MRYLGRFAIIFFLLNAFSFHLVPAHGAPPEIDPFYTRHLNPVIQLFGLPPAEGAALVPAGRLDTRLFFDGSNNFSRSSSAVEALLFDGETYRTTLGFRLGLPKGLEVGIDIPFVAHEGGIFDGLISDFHETFGFVANSRDDAENNNLNYRYERDGITRFSIDEPVSGFGDILLSGGLQLYRREKPAPRALALRAYLKLPVGEAKKLTGSNSTDFALSLAASDSVWLAEWRLTLYGALGGLVMGDGEVLEEQHRRLAGFGYAGIGWAPLRWMALKLQVDGHTSFFNDSEFEAINSWSTQLAGGFTFYLPREVVIDVAILENILVETAPDVSLHLGVQKRF